MLTQSCAHAMLLCVKPQEAALAHTQQRAPLTKKAKKKRNLASVRSQNFSDITRRIAASS